MKIQLTERQTAYLVRHYPNTKNDVLMEKLGIRFSTFHRIVRSLGLKKTARFMAKCQKATSEAAKASHLRNGTYPPKGYIIPRSEEFRFRKGETCRDRIGGHREAWRIKRAAATRAKTFREEQVRRRWGLPQKTGLRVAQQPMQKIKDRCYLKRRGYVLDETNLIAYWTPDTRRAVRLEKGPRRFYKFQELKND